MCVLIIIGIILGVETIHAQIFQQPKSVIALNNTIVLFTCEGVADDVEVIHDNNIDVNITCVEEIAVYSSILCNILILANTRSNGTSVKCIFKNEGTNLELESEVAILTVLSGLTPPNITKSTHTSFTLIVVWSRLWNLPVGNYILTVTNTANGTTTNHTTNETSFTIQISPKYMCDILSFSVTAVTDIGLIKSEVTQFIYSDCITSSSIIPPSYSSGELSFITSTASDRFISFTTYYTFSSKTASVDLMNTPTITSNITESGQDINYKTITILTTCVMGGLLLLLSVIASLLLVIIIHHKRHKAKKRNGRSDLTSTTQRTQSFSSVLPNKMHENPIYERSIYDIMIHHKDLRSLTEDKSKIFPIYEEIPLKSGQAHKKFSSNEKMSQNSRYIEMSPVTSFSPRENK